MALNIKNAEVEALAGEVARAAGESKTEAIRRALEERKARLAVRPLPATRQQRLESLLRNVIWPSLPPGVRGVAITKEEEEEILGFKEGSEG